MATYFERENEWLIPKDDAHFETLTASLTGLSKRFKQFAEKESANFCDAVRKTLSDITRDKPEMPKAKMCRKFKMSARAVNMAKKVGSAMAASAKEGLELKKAELDDKIKEAEKELKQLQTTLSENEWDWRMRCNLGDKKAASKLNALKRLKNRISGKKAHIARLKKKYARLPERPGVFVFGKTEYLNQPKHDCSKQERNAWRRGFREARNCMFGAPGSSDEAAGNSTYRITYKRDLTKCVNFLGKKKVYTVVEFDVWHKGKLAGHFCLRERSGRELLAIVEKNGTKFDFEEVLSETVTNADGTPKKVWRKVRTGRVALKVFFMRKGNAWNIYVSYPMTSKPKNIDVKGTVGFDTNHGHMESMEVSRKGFVLGRYHRNAYPVNGTREEKRRAISAIVRQVVFRAHEMGYAVVLENLDFEYAKSMLRNKLGETLRAMPYKAFVAKVRRECARMGVPLRFIAPAYTSVLGNILPTLNCRLSRDVAAAGVIALLGLEGGGQHLLSLVDCIESAGEDGEVRWRINEKNKCGRHVQVVGINLRQSDSKASLATGPKKPLKQVGVAVKDIAKAVGALRRSGRIICRASNDERKQASRRVAETRRQSQKQRFFASRCLKVPSQLNGELCSNDLRSSLSRLE